MPVWKFDDFADIYDNAKRIVPRKNKNVQISVDSKFLYINGFACPTGTGATGMIMQCGGTGVSWVEPSSVGAGATGAQGVTGAYGGPQGATGLGNFTQKTDFNVGVNVPEIMWNFQDETFYGYVTGVNHWVQISAGSTVGATGLMGPTGIRGTTGAQGSTGIKGSTGVQGATGRDGAYAAQGVTGLQGATGAGGGSEVVKYATGAMSFTGLSIGSFPELSIPSGVVAFDYMITVGEGGSAPVYIGYTGIVDTFKSSVMSVFSSPRSLGFTSTYYSTDYYIATSRTNAPVFIQGTGYKTGGPVTILIGRSDPTLLNTVPGSYIRYRVF